MTDALSPHDIARRTFEVARRGYEQQEVRGFLHEVSALIERLNRSEVELRERAERAEARLGMAEAPDEAMLLEVLGEETTRVLTSAREAATEIRTKAEAAAARIISDATAVAAETRGSATRDADAVLLDARRESDALLETARTELERRRAEAAEAAEQIRAAGAAGADALRDEGRAELARAQEEGEATRETARQEGRAMVAEAQVVRERVLRDLAARRKRARQQVEKLNAGRERLLEAYEVVRHTIGEATSELSVSLVEARVAADAAARRVDEEPEPTLEQLDEEVANAGLVDLPITDVDPIDEDAGGRPGDDAPGDDGPGPFSGEIPVIEADAPPPSPPPVAAPAVAEAAAEALQVRSEDDRRGRKRKKDRFEGLPEGELSVVEPASADEGVRILAPLASDEVTDHDAVAEPIGAPGDEVTQDDVATSEEEALADGSVEASEEAPEPAAVAEPLDAERDVDDATGDDVQANEEEVEPASDEEVETGGAEPAAGDEPGSQTADEVFARLRAEREGAEAAEPEVTADGEVAVESEAPADRDTAEKAAAPPEDAEDAGEAEVAVPDDTGGAFTARRTAVEPVEKDLSRRLKRALADEQNEVLDLLRRAKPKSVDDLLPPLEEHAGRWSSAVVEVLVQASGAGVAWTGGVASPVADLADELARGLTTPLRERIDRSFTASDGNLDDVADRVRALYREWKGQRLAETTEHYVAAAYARGVFDGIDGASAVRWVVDPAAGACPDCDDNVLAGDLAKGEDFPTGNPCAPAHPGCHCLVLPAAD